MKIRHQFVLLALEPDANISELCREHGISRKTAYKWLERFKDRGVQGLEDLSRRPHNSPLRASGEMRLGVSSQTLRWEVDPMEWLRWQAVRQGWRVRVPGGFA